jgi:hypothetical protein
MCFKRTAFRRAIGQLDGLFFSIPMNRWRTVDLEREGEREREIAGLIVPVIWRKTRKAIPFQSAKQPM